MSMNGFVMNVTPTWKHAMKRAVSPCGKIPLDELFEQYGKNYELTEGTEFVQWLRDVKLRDHNTWSIVFSETGGGAADEVETLKENTVQKPSRMADNVAPIVLKEAVVADVVTLSVRKAKDVLPKIHDYNLLKYALQEARQLSGKDTLCIMLRKRIEELELSR